MTHRIFIIALLLCLGAAPAAAATPRPPKPAARPERVMVVLVFGQSNAANFGETRRTAGPRAQALFGPSLTRAADPLPGADGLGGSPWTRLADDIIAAGWYDRVILVPAAIGGTEINEWTPERDTRFRLIRSQIQAAQARGLRFTHLLWHQGESDNALHIDPTYYRLRFLSMLKGIRELGVSAPVFVAQATICGVYGPSKDLRWVQRDIVNHDAGIWQGPDTDALGPEFRHDGCHMSARGLEAHAQLWMDFLAVYERR